MAKDYMQQQTSQCFV